MRIKQAGNPRARGRNVGDTRARTRMPIARLLEGPEVIYKTRGADYVQSPAFVPHRQRKRVINVQKDKLIRREFLVKVTWDGEREFRSEWQQPAQAVGAETIRVPTCAC